MDKRYRALRIISTLYKILGAIVLVIAVLSSIGLCLTTVLGGSMLQQVGMPSDMAGASFLTSAFFGVILGLGSLIGGGLSGLSLFAMGEGISLAIAVEENTRATAMYLAGQGRPAAPVYTPPAG